MTFNIFKITLILVFVGIFYSCQTEKSIVVNYPETKKVDTADTYFGTKVKDPYRWLENDRSRETEAWVERE